MERRFLALVQMRRVSVVPSGYAIRELGLTRLQEVELFRRLSRGRIIARVRPGLYLVPEHLPLGESWTPGEYQALRALMRDRGAKYQICGLNVFNRYGYDEQVPNRLYVYNNRISGSRSIGAVQLMLIKVADERLGGTVEVGTATGDTVPFPTRERALVDAVYDWARFGTLPRAYNWIRADLKRDRISPDVLVRMALEFADVGARRRISYLLERESVENRLLKKLERSLRRTRSTIPWIPRKKKIGKVIQRWGVVDNSEAR